MGRKRQMVSVTQRALIQRINRRLAGEHEQLKATRGDGRARQDLGDYYVLDLFRNFVVATDVDPAELGRELGVLHPWEELEEAT